MKGLIPALILTGLMILASFYLMPDDPALMLAGMTLGLLLWDYFE